MPKRDFLQNRVIQICGTGSDVGKSIIVTALCRIFLQDGFSTCPFKAQNMSLNSFVTKDGGEMGRAQVAQAQASRIEPSVDMNPILIKPITNIGAQLIVGGKPIGNISAGNYQNRQMKAKLFIKVKESFRRLYSRYEIIVIEGAGSPAEINLKSHDIVNMRMAEFAKAPVILVGDIDKGGVFASLIGTIELLNKKERGMIKGFIINKFRGDKTLLKDGIDFLEKKTAKPVLGVIPYFEDLRIPDEDSVVLEKKRCATEEPPDSKKALNIAVISLPHMSNFTDFAALEAEPDVNLYYTRDKDGLKNPDVIILPGTKNTIADLLWLKQSGIANQILFDIMDNGLPPILIGICGGFQMLGRRIYDKNKIESGKKETNGLGLLPIITHLKKEKILSQVKAEEISSGLAVSGYEIHHGCSKNLENYPAFLKITERLNRKVKDIEGLASKDRRVWGTYIHGIFDSDAFRRDFLNRIRKKKNLPLLPKTNFNLDKEYDKLAGLVRKNINLRLLYKILGAKL